VHLLTSHHETIAVLPGEDSDNDIALCAMLRMRQGANWVRFMDGTVTLIQWTVLERDSAGLPLKITAELFNGEMEVLT
jgi:hypothetical protein